MATTATTHQTVHLGRGRHRSADSGACVMELASMLAGERFSDRPACVSPVIGAFMRSYNDQLSDRHRQALYGWAAEVVGTAGPEHVERARVEHCLRRAAEWRRERSPLIRWLLPRARAPRRNRPSELEELGLALVRVLRPRRELGRRRAETLIGELAAIGLAERPPAPAPAPAPQPAPV